MGFKPLHRIDSLWLGSLLRLLMLLPLLLLLLVLFSYFLLLLKHPNNIKCLRRQLYQLNHKQQRAKKKLYVNYPKRNEMVPPVRNDEIYACLVAIRLKKKTKLQLLVVKLMILYYTYRADMQSLRLSLLKMIHLRQLIYSKFCVCCSFDFL